MMAIKFNKFERVAGLFVMIFIVSGIVGAAVVAIKRDWFAPRIRLVTDFENADGVHSGTEVLIAGLRAGSVDSVELLDTNKIRLTFSLLERFKPKIKDDSLAQLIRPFVIGERVLELTVGSKESPEIQENAMMKSHETLDVMTVLSGRRLGDYLEAMNGLLVNVKILVDAFTNTQRTESIVKTFDQIEPLVRNLNTMSEEVIKLSRQATRKDNLGTVLSNLSTTTNQLNEMIPLVIEKAPSMGKDITKIMQNLAVLTDNFKLLTPTIVQMAPSLPKTSRRAVEALDEAVILLKAMQKSMFVRGNVEEVRDEESKRREPAEEKNESIDPAK
jgi:phospholipid/cholesterol/gamma-HCH transport system substrate-binding protein